MNQVDLHMDLETGSLRENAAIFSIGAVAVKGHEIIDRFHIRIDPHCYENRHRIFDNYPWWLENNIEEYNLIEEEGIPLGQALHLFNEWLSRWPVEQVKYWQKRWWDILWLESAYFACSMECPVRYSAVRELVTHIEAIGGNPSYKNDNLHNALADAEAQAMAWITAELNHVCKN